MSNDLDLIIEGNILTMSGAKPRVGAVGVRAGLIIMTGTPAEVEKYAGKKTRIRKLRGKTITPGFIDTHAHPVQKSAVVGFRIWKYHWQNLGWVECNETQQSLE